MNPTTQKGYWTEGTIVGGTNVGGGQFVPNTEPISKVITQDDLNKTTKLNPVPPITPITPYTPTVTAPSGMAISADGTASYTPPAQKVESQATSSLYQKALSDIGVDITQLEKRPEVQAQLQEQQQLAQKTEQATKDYNTYNLRKRELEKKIQEMEATNPQGQFGGAREAVINDYRRKANSELADLAIQAQASQGLLDAARQTIKDTIDAQFSPIEDRIARRTQYAQLAANDLTESEKYQLDQLNKKDEANQKEVSIYATNLANTVFENGAPVGVRTKIFNIAGDYATGKITKEQAQAKMMEAAGNYGVNLTDRAYKQAQIDNINAQIRERANQEQGTSTAKPLTAAQSTALGYGERTLQASIIIDDIGDQFTGILSRFAGYVPRGLQTENRQKFEQAKRNFINAVLRRESGAAISPTEYSSAEQQYFPQPGDKQAVLIQKKQNRDLVVKNLLRESGVDTTAQDVSLADPLGLGIINNNPLEI